jgi:hypothetical protein
MLPNARPAVSVSLLTVAIVVAQINHQSRSPDAPQTVAGAIGRVEHRGWRVVPSDRAGNLHLGAYLTAAREDPDRVRGLLRDSSRIDRWRGVAFISEVKEPDEAGRWSDRAVRAGPLTLFGDAAMVEAAEADLMTPGPR